jgi:hypothetical protein
MVTLMRVRACVHCSRVKKIEARGMCGACYRSPVRGVYPCEDADQMRGNYGDVCRHCEKMPVNRPRGLCWTCYYTPGVRGQYPPLGKAAHRGVGNLTGEQPLPAEPCGHPPGTPEKLACLAERARRGEQLFHPADAGCGEG